MSKLKDTDLLELPKGALVKDLAAACHIAGTNVIRRALLAQCVEMSVSTFHHIRTVAVTKYGAKKKTLSEVTV